MKVSQTFKNDIASAYPEPHAAWLNVEFTFVDSGMTDQLLSVSTLTIQYEEL
ncbi:hypothetical protein [Vibrio marisflavi]|uniref:Uncharacterized protein n=1 Tax=Vibrio marisflavi CECT 7928 TaxID=634439 RepID=A0ABN8E176_9VIBR|nr:hypothetical protein [Vibrio marisflavi]CAH0537177.1 hypothetical protein VMF7928_00977 [Vibrio marisflavi CECT 7928]